jgi:hypothetical protein
LKTWSSRRIAEACGVESKMVDRLRPASTAPEAQLTTVGRDGKARKPRERRRGPRAQEQPRENGKAASPASPDGDDDDDVEAVVALGVAEPVVRHQFAVCRDAERLAFVAAIRGVCDDLEALMRERDAAPDLEDI